MTLRERNMRRAIIFSILVVLLVCAVGCAKVDEGKGTVTDDSGVGNVDIGGKAVKVIAVNKNSPSEPVSGVKLSTGEQQGIGMVYSTDAGGEYFPNLTFMSEGLGQTDLTTVQLVPAQNKDWIFSEPVKLNINIDKLPRKASFEYAELVSFLADEMPEVKIVVFLFTEEVVDIERCYVSIYSSPFSEVIYAHISETIVGSTLEIMPRVYAIDPASSFAAAVWMSTQTPTGAALLGAAAGAGLAAAKFLASELKQNVVMAAATKLLGKGCGQGYIEMPNLKGLTKDEARQLLTDAGIPDNLLKLNVVELSSKDCPAKEKQGVVIDQVPIPGNCVDLWGYIDEAEELPIMIVVCKGPDEKQTTKSEVSEAILKISTMAEWVENNETATIRFYISITPQVTGTVQKEDRGHHTFVSQSDWPQAYGSLTDPGELLQEVAVPGGAGVGVQELTFDITEYVQKNGITTYYIAADNSGPALAMFNCMLFYETRNQKGHYPFGNAGEHQVGLFGPAHPLVIKWGRNPGSAAEIRLDPP